MIKAQARATLRGGWLKAIAALVILLCYFAFVDCIISIPVAIFFNDTPNELYMDIIGYTVTPLVGFAAAFLLSPFINGYIRLFYLGGVNNRYDMTDILYYFQKGNYSKALSVNIRFILRMILPTLIAFIPVIVYSVICSVNAYDFPSMSFFYFILSVLSAFITILWSLRYFLVYIYAVDFEYLEASELFRCSKRMMYGKTGMTAKLLLSFFPWLLLSMTILPILYTAPYITQSLCISAKWIARSNTPTMNSQEG